MKGRRRSVLWLMLGFALSGGGTGATAQVQVPEHLSLEKALDIARANNPGLRQTLNDEELADWDVRQAYGALLPSASASAGASWQGAGETQVGSLTLGDLGFGDQPSYLGSSYSLGVDYSLDWAKLMAPRQAKRDRDVTLAGIRRAEADLETQVTNGYVDLLRQDDALRNSEAQLENARFNLRLAEGRLAVGQVTAIDGGQAEVEVGRAEVAVLQARNRVGTSRVRLLQLMGAPLGQAFEPTTELELTEPTWSLDELIEWALQQNPELQRRQLSLESAEVGVNSARSAYFPSLSISTGWSGFTNEASNVNGQVAQAEARVSQSIQSCQATNDLHARLTPPLPPMDCSQFAFTAADRKAIIDQNNVFPFSFTRAPPRVSFQVSLPIFSGLSRQRGLEAARLARRDLREQVREQEIAVEADLAIGLANTRTLYESVLLEDRNRALAQRQLDLARERYRIGAITFVELVTAQAQLVQAEASRTAALFLYHDSVTTLEGLVGTSLRF